MSLDQLILLLTLISVSCEQAIIINGKEVLNDHRREFTYLQNYTSADASLNGTENFYQSCVTEYFHWESKRYGTEVIDVRCANEGKQGNLYCQTETISQQLANGIHIKRGIGCIAWVARHCVLT